MNPRFETMKERKARATRPPCRSLPELAEEFGISPVTLGRLLMEPGAPAPAIDGRKHAHSNRVRWYVVADVRKWWAERKFEPSERAEYMREYAAKRKSKKEAA